MGVDKMRILLVAAFIFFVCSTCGIIIIVRYFKDLKRRIRKIEETLNNLKKDA